MLHGGDGGKRRRYSQRKKKAAGSVKGCGRGRNGRMEKKSKEQRRIVEK